MAISIRNPKVEHLARELSRRSDVTMTDAIGQALEARLAGQDENRRIRRTALVEIAAECAALPDLDRRSADEILGYAETGAFTDGDR